MPNIKEKIVPLATTWDHFWKLERIKLIEVIETYYDCIDKWISEFVKLFNGSINTTSYPHIRVFREDIVKLPISYYLFGGGDPRALRLPYSNPPPPHWDFATTEPMDISLMTEPMDISPMTEPATVRQTVSWKSILRDRLSQDCKKMFFTDSHKDEYIESILKGDVNDILRKRTKWLLPNDTTLWQLVNNNHGDGWAQLVAVLVEIAERGKNTLNNTFPIADTLQSALAKAIDYCKSHIPFHEQVLYNPAMLPGDRAELWRAEAETLFTKQEIVKCLGLPDAVLRTTLSPTVMASYFEQLDKKLKSDSDLRKKWIENVKERRSEWPIARFEILEDELFPTDALAVHQELNFTPPSNWTNAKDFLGKLDIVNPTLEKNLDKAYAHGHFKRLRGEDAWRAKLKEMGATGFDDFDVYDALLEKKLIN